MGWQDAPLAEDDGGVKASWESAPLEEEQAPVSAAPKQTLGQRVQETYGLEEGIDRPVISILGTRSEEGEYIAPAWVESLARSVELPGHVARGGEYGLSDVTEMAGAVGVPALRGVGGTVTSKVKQEITRQMVKEAPTAKQLREQGSNLFKAAKGSNAVVSDEGVLNLVVGLQDHMNNQGLKSSMLHPKSNAVMQELANEVGNVADFDDLMTMRRMAGIAASSTEPDDSRLGIEMVKYIDDYIDNISVDDLVGGTGEQAAKAASDLVKARALWGRMRKREAIDDIFTKADNQGSGFENGLRVGFRQLLNNKKKLRGFTENEIDAMRKVVQGDFTTNTLKKIGKLGAGLGQQSNIVGASIAVGGGAAIGGPLGAMAVPLIGTGAQKLAERGTRLAAEKARAITSGVTPSVLGVPKGTQGAPRAALGLLGASALPSPRGDFDKERTRRILAGEEFL